MRTLLFSCKTTSTIIFHEILLLLFIALIFDCSATFRGNGRHLRARSRHNDNNGFEDRGDGEEWGGTPFELISLSEEEVVTTSEYNGDNFVYKRTVRSPLDDDIDEVEDSDEDDEDDVEESSSEKRTKASTSQVTTPKPTVSSTAPDTKKLFHLPGNGSIESKNASNKHINSPAVAANISFPPSEHSMANPKNGSAHGKVPGNGRALPPGLLFGPPGAVAGFKPPHGGGPLISGKLPPHLLKHLSKPKPPPKKGELYLPEDYNNLVIPKLNLGKLIGIDSYSAVPVLVYLNIRSVRDIDETLETLTLDVDLVIEWVDGFLFDPISAITARQADITLNPIFLKKIWRPDIYIDEIVKVKRTSLMSKPLKLKFNPSNGFISYTTRLTVQLSCDMIYFYYPADTHRCEFTFRSYSYFSKDMQLSWLGAGVYLQDPYDPNFDLQVESIDHVKLPQTFRKLTNDTFDSLKFTLLARRKLSFHMVQTYLPSIFFIVITWLCFLVPARMVEARIGISMTTLLTLTSMFASVRESTPIVSYVKAIDIWMVFCIFFVFLTLLEFATLVWLRSRREDAEEQKLEQKRKVQAMQGNGKRKDLEASLSHSFSSESINLRKYEKFAEFTEKYAFLIFSVVFLVFNVIYWSWLLTASNYFDWSVNATLNAELD